MRGRKEFDKSRVSLRVRGVRERVSRYSQGLGCRYSKWLREAMQPAYCRTSRFDASNASRSTSGGEARYLLLGEITVAAVFRMCRSARCFLKSDRVRTPKSATLAHKLAGTWQED